MTEKQHPRFTDPVDVVLLRPGEPAPEDAIERAKRVLREREAEQQAKREAAR